MYCMYTKWFVCPRNSRITPPATTYAWNSWVLNEMLQLSYWLFPIIFMTFLFAPSWRNALFPGLLAACFSGAANSGLLEKYPMVVAHCLASSLFFYIYALGRKNRRVKKTDGISALVFLCTWMALAVMVTSFIPLDSWPYSFSKDQMLSIFLPSLVLGSVITSTNI